MVDNASTSISHLPSPDRTSENAPDNDQRPLEGVVLCCTSIPPEHRDTMCDAAQEMGAATKLDLTKDVTHLIVGATDTPKYKYVARERPDIRVLLPSWLEAVRGKWIAGEAVNVRSLALEHRLPTLWSQHICVTGFNDLQERNDIQEAVIANGASYHGDLTKQVSHLIAAAPSGKKYEYAGQWGIKIVTIEWLQQSLQRGMMLDETLYRPTIPVHERGAGAVKTLQRQQSEVASLGKRKSVDGSSGPIGPDGKRKLRRTASTKLEHTNSGIWDDMSTAGVSQAKPGAEWDDGGTADHRRAKEPQQNTDSHDGEESQPSIARAGENVMAEAQEQAAGIFDICSFTILGFERRQFSILSHHARLNGAEIIDSEQLARRATARQENLFCIVPWDAPHNAIQEELRCERVQQDRCSVVTNHWMEKCITKKSLFDADALPIYRPLRKTVFPEFHDWTITPTSFADIELLHFSKAVKLIGAKYDESLSCSTKVLVSGPNGPPNPEKLGFAFDNGIPAVTNGWFWACLEKGEVQDMDEYSIMGQSSKSGSLKAKLQEAKREEELKDRSNALSDAGQLDANTAMMPEKVNTEQSPRRKSQPLREMADSESNSQRRAKAVEPGVAEKPDGKTSAQRSPKSPKPAIAAENADRDETIEVTENDPFISVKPVNDISFMSHDDEPFQPPSETASAPPNQTATQQSRQEQQDAISNAIDRLRANAQSASGIATESSPHRRRHRKLGRAVSNPSSIGSRTNSMQFLPPLEENHDDDDDGYDGVRKKREQFMPSQALMYEHEESKLVREKLLRRRITDDYVDENGMKRVESIGRVTDAVNPKFERKASTRRGATR